MAPPFPRPSLARGTSVPQLVPSGTLVDRWDLGSPAVRLQVEPSQARIGDCAPLQLGSRKGSVGWVESWTGSPGEGSPKFGDNLRVSRFGEVPKLSGLCPGSPRFPLGPSQGFRITRSESTVVPCDSQVISRRDQWHSRVLSRTVGEGADRAQPRLATRSGIFSMPCLLGNRTPVLPRRILGSMW